MNYVDIPSISDIRSLAKHRANGSITIVLRTTPVTQDAQADRIKLHNLAREAIDQLADSGLSKTELSALEAQFADIIEDDEFWVYQAESLVLFATPLNLKTYRLPNHLTDMVQVSDRFHLPPLLRALAFPHHAYVLALGQNGARVIEMTGDRPAGQVRLADMPTDAASVARKASIAGRAPKGRLQGSEGQKVHLLAYARQVDAALRPLFSGKETPLVLVANEPLRSIFLSVCHHHEVLKDIPADVSDNSPNHDLATSARAILDAYYAKEIAAIDDLFRQRLDDRRASSEIEDVARMATYGGVDTLLIDMDSEIPGRISETDGAIDYAEDGGSETYDILGELACRTLLTGGRVFSIRKEDLPENSPVAALLRLPI